MAKWNITILGVRGSFPNTGANCRGFGSNTSCISLNDGESALILDAGSGLAEYERTLCDGRSRFDILLSHLHMDHILGLFSFGQLFDPQKEIHLYGTEGFQEQLRILIGPPYWPVGFRDFPAKVIFHGITAGDSFRIGEFRVDTMAANHPNNGILYRLRKNGIQLVYTLDCELSDSFRPQLTEFCHGSDLIVWDANFTSADWIPGWGHSTWEQGLDIRRASESKQILMTHYNRSYTDEFLRQQQTAAETLDNACLFARERMVLTL